MCVRAAVTDKVFSCLSCSVAVRQMWAVRHMLLLLLQVLKEEVQLCIGCSPLVFKPSSGVGSTRLILFCMRNMTQFTTHTFSAISWKLHCMQWCVLMCLCLCWVLSLFSIRSLAGPAHPVHRGEPHWEITRQRQEPPEGETHSHPEFYWFIDLLASVQICMYTFTIGSPQYSVQFVGVYYQKLHQYKN